MASEELQLLKELLVIGESLGTVGVLSALGVWWYVTHHGSKQSGNPTPEQRQELYKTIAKIDTRGQVVESKVGGIEGDITEIKKSQIALAKEFHQHVADNR
tara:strand:+ start:150 stop:452 length:303 start_codon:yes stop_codon:yes gene_type:complete